MNKVDTPESVRCPKQKRITAEMAVQSVNIRERAISGAELCDQECPVPGGLARDRTGFLGRAVQVIFGPETACSKDINLP